MVGPNVSSLMQASEWSTSTSAVEERADARRRATDSAPRARGRPLEIGIRDYDRRVLAAELEAVGGQVAPDAAAIASPVLVDPVSGPRPPQRGISTAVAPGVPIFPRWRRND